MGKSGTELKTTDTGGWNHWQASKGITWRQDHTPGLVSDSMEPRSTGTQEGHRTAPS